ncbi:O-methyltransferase [Aspergillus homomorphus CBS 101889]|uniref:catechol O-methyltransferase n=1 Tax=Aspergillus homomorphus (strain CBS 101889) TaxID=1450537 RepID=A0A395I2I6_ASPHC|nr:S-adenosyl-L-methionine-dependent methyltransferase [Aspergillus homomorphus CBS 101889]RAL14157.1 S-adenosyl-L-methionine-dependent methyltransferase [Aspergillus homomorphus CBS 101889]
MPDTEEPPMFTKYPSLRKMAALEESEIVESHDGREITLLKHIYAHPELDTKLRGSPVAILEVMDEFAAQEDFLINIGPDKAGKLAVLVREHRPRVVVELGGYVGYSAILFGSILKEIWTQNHPNNADLEGEDDHSKDQPRLYSIEIDPLVASIAMNLVSLAGLQGFVEVVVGASAHTLRRMHEQGTFSDRGIDLLFMDHDEALYAADIQVAEELGLLKTDGALVIADNVMRPGAPAYRDYMRKNPRLRQSWGLPGLIVPGDLADEMEISVVGRKMLSEKKPSRAMEKVEEENWVDEQKQPDRKRKEVTN